MYFGVKSVGLRPPGRCAFSGSPQNPDNINNLNTIGQALLFYQTAGTLDNLGDSGGYLISMGSTTGGVGGGL